MQIAKMFASLGFTVDVSGLNTFKKELDSSKPSVTKFSVSIRNLSNQLNTLGDKLIRVNQNLKFGGGKGKKADDGYRDMTVATDKLVRALDGIIKKQPSTTKAFGKIHSSLIHGTPLWSKYADQVARVRSGLIDSNQQLRNLRNGANQRINLGGGFGGGAGGGGGYGGGYGGGGRPSGGAGSNRTSWLGDSGYQFFRSMAPSALISTGLAGAGYGLKEIVQRGREQTKMENVLMFSSRSDDNGADFRESLDFVRKTAMDLGTSSQEMGKAYAQINMSAGDALTKDEKQSLFYDMAKSFVTMGATKDEQFLLYKAVNQMFSLGRIQAEEMNQLTGQGLVPRKLVYDAVKEIYGVKTNKEVAALQKANQLDPSKIMPHVFGAMSQKADETGAFAAYKASSLYQQNLLLEQFNTFSKKVMDGGLDSFLRVVFSTLLKLLTFVDGTVIPTLEKVVKPLKEIFEYFGHVKGIIEMFMGEGTVLATFLGVLVYRFLGVRTVLIRAGQALLFVRTMSGSTLTAFRVLFGFIGKFIFRLGVFGLAFWVLYKIAQAANARMKGELSWADVWSLKLQILLADFEIFFLELKLKWRSYRLWIRSFNPLADHAEIEDIRRSIEYETTGGNIDKAREKVLSFADTITFGAYGKLKDLLRLPQPNYGSSNRDTNVNINLTRDGRLIQTETIPQGNSSHIGVTVP